MCSDDQAPHPHFLDQCCLIYLQGASALQRGSSAPVSFVLTQRLLMFRGIVLVFCHLGKMYFIVPLSPELAACNSYQPELSGVFCAVVCKF